MNLVPIHIDGWMLFGDGRDFWIKDLDLAERAALVNARDIRTHITKAIKDGLLSEIGVVAGDANNGAYFRAVTEAVTSGKGRSQDVTAYYLNREAAVLITMRLRTPKAVQLQVAVVRVFLLAVDGKLSIAGRTGTAPAAIPEAVLASLDEFSQDHCEDLIHAIDLLSYVQGAVTPKLCQIAGAARAYQMRCFGDGGHPLGTRPSPRVLAEAARDALASYLPTPEEARKRALLLALSKAKADLEAKATQARRQAEEEARQRAMLPKTAHGRAILAAVDKIPWKTTGGDTLRYLATRCDESGTVRDLNYKVECKNVGRRGTSPYWFRKNCEEVLYQDAWLLLIGAEHGQPIFQLLVGKAPWYCRGYAVPSVTRAAFKAAKDLYDSGEL
jgi:hypothetical protein